MKNPVVHFEMPYEDQTRVAKFYKNVFGWEMNQMGKDMGEYITAATAETDEKRMVKTPGTINGGFFKRAKPDQGVSVVISVNDIQKAMKDIAVAGGKVRGEPVEIPGIGTYASFTDTEGNHVSMLQPMQGK